MMRFYRNAFALFIALVCVTTFIIYAGAVKSRVSHSLYPRKSDLPWTASTEPSSSQNKTWLTVDKNPDTITYEFFLDPENAFPYTHYAFDFTGKKKAYRAIDLTGYDRISFKIHCDPKNVLMFVLFSFDDRITDPRQPASRRVSSTAFSCTANWETMTIAFDELITPYWWLERYGFELSDRGYQLGKSMGFALVNSLQSPVGTLSRVQLKDVQIVGRKPVYLYASAGVSTLLWLVFFGWTARRYPNRVATGFNKPNRQDHTLIPYEPLFIDSPKDKQKQALLQYMATEYRRATLSLDQTATELGINRTKINEILREAVGLTFRTYLNQLRMAEAARLLSHNENVNVSQIAYLVGYNSVSYFNKLFKAEYGRTPRDYRNQRRPEAC